MVRRVVRVTQGALFGADDLEGGNDGVASRMYQIPTPNRWRDRLAVLFVLAFVLYASVVTFSKTSTPHPRLVENANNQEFPMFHGSGGPQPSIYVKREPSGTNLDLVWKVFKQLGFTKSNDESTWDVYWTFSYFHDETVTPLSLQPGQLYNHFPALGWLTAKSALPETLEDETFFPKTYTQEAASELFSSQSAEEFDPSRLWVIKSAEHRGVVIKREEDITPAVLTEDHVMQQFLSPLLIDNAKWDIGVYVFIASFSDFPNNIYFFDDVLVRFCMKDYPAKTAEEFRVLFEQGKVNRDMYVVEEPYRAAWDMPSLKPLYDVRSDDVGRNGRKVLNEYFRANGMTHVADSLWLQLELFILKSFSKVVSDVKDASKAYSDNQRHFFELLRFDFLLTDDLTPYLLEVNMSPNLHPKTPIQKHLQSTILKEIAPELLSRFSESERFSPGTAWGSDAVADTSVESKFRPVSVRNQSFGLGGST